MSRNWRVKTRLAAAALAAGAVLAGFAAAPAAALPTDKSEAEGRVLSGGGSINLNDIAALTPAYSADPSSPEVVQNNLDVTALKSLNLDLGNGIQLGDASELLGAGILGQYAAADKDGVPFASSGAIQDDGSIAVAPNNEPGTPDDQNAYVDLTGALGQAGVEDLISELRLELGALSASATYENGEPTGEYQVADGKLWLKSPAVADIAAQLSDTAEKLSDPINGLTGEDGTLSGIIAQAVEAASIAGLADVNVKVELEVDLKAALESALEEAITDENSAVGIDLSEGALTIDLAKLVKDSQPDDKFYGTLNGLPENTEIVDPQLIQAALDGAIGTLLDQIPAAAAEAIADTLNSTEIVIEIEATTAVGSATIALVDPETGEPGTVGQLLGTDEPATKFVVDGDAGLAGPVVSLLVPVLNETVLPLVQGAVKTVADKIEDPGALDTVFRPLVEAIRDAIKPVFDAVAESVLSILVNVVEEPGEFTHPGAEGDVGAKSLRRPCGRTVPTPSGPSRSPSCRTM